MKYIECDILFPYEKFKDYEVMFKETLVPYKKAEILTRPDGKFVCYKNSILTHHNKAALLEMKKYINFYLEGENCNVLNEGDIYTIISDGGSFNNGYKDKSLPMFASSATVILKNNNMLENFVKLYDDETNNYGELKGCLNGLYKLKEKLTTDELKVAKIICVSDSQYLINTATSYIYKWKKNNWKLSSGKNVLNQDIWKDFLENFISNNTFDLSFCWLRGHTKNSNNIYYMYNNIADEAAQSAIKEKVNKLKKG